MTLAIMQERSRALIMAGHTIVGVGFALGPFIISRHFPLEDGAKKHQKVCSNLDSTSEANDTVVSDTNVDDLVDIEAPWHELGGATIILGLLFLIPIFLPWKMPGKYYN